VRSEAAQTRTTRPRYTNVQELGWAGIKNGALLKLANGQFDALLTVDQVDDLRPLLPAVEQALATLRAGDIIRVGGS